MDKSIQNNWTDSKPDCCKPDKLQQFFYAQKQKRSVKNGKQNPRGILPMCPDMGSACYSTNDTPGGRFGLWNFCITDDSRLLPFFYEKFKLSGMKSKSAFLRKLILYGYVYDVDYSFLREIRIFSL